MLRRLEESGLLGLRQQIEGALLILVRQFLALGLGYLAFFLRQRDAARKEAGLVERGLPIVRGGASELLRKPGGLLGLSEPEPNQPELEARVRPPLLRSGIIGVLLPEESLVEVGGLR